MRVRRFMYWAPWGVTEPWKPRGWKGCDEHHNTAVSVVLPFLGAFHWFYGPFDPSGEEHLSGYSPEEGWTGRDVEGCRICQEVKEV